MDRKHSFCGADLMLAFERQNIPKWTLQSALPQHLSEQNDNISIGANIN